MPFNAGDRVRRVRDPHGMLPLGEYVVSRYTPRPTDPLGDVVEVEGDYRQFLAEYFELITPEIEDRFIIFFKRPGEDSASAWSLMAVNRQQAEHIAADSSRARGRADWVFYLVPVRAVAAYQNGNLLTD